MNFNGIPHCPDIHRPSPVISTTAHLGSSYCWGLGVAPFQNVAMTLDRSTLANPDPSPRSISPEIHEGEFFSTSYIQL